MTNPPWANVLPSRWYSVRSAPASGVRNMAVDAALLSAARSRPHGVLRVYDWVEPTISFGRNEATRSRFDAASVAAAGFQAVRRPTGGRALLHASEVTYSFSLPLADDVPWTRVYVALNDTLLAALLSLGVKATLVTSSTAAPVRPDGPLCFDRPAEGEIVVGSAKLVGSAVWRERGAYLQHGSILLHDRQHQLRSALANVSTEDTMLRTPPAASLATCLPAAPSWESVAAALESALEGALHAAENGEFNGASDATSHGAANGTPRSAATPTPGIPTRASRSHTRDPETSAVVASSLDELLDADELARHEVRFRDDAWLWRR